MTSAYPIRSKEETLALALQIVGWIVSDQDRAERVLALTGLDPDGLRAALGQPATLGALLDVLLNHEPDLLACARALDVAPAEIVAARSALMR